MFIFTRKPFLNLGIPLQSMVQRVETMYLEEGHWFVSIYNDDGDSQAVELTISTSAQLTGSPSHGIDV